MPPLTVYKGSKKELVLAFDVGTTYSGISYWCVVSVELVRSNADVFYTVFSNLARSRRLKASQSGNSLKFAEQKLNYIYKISGPGIFSRVV